MDTLDSLKKQIEHLSDQVESLTLLGEVIARNAFGIVITDRNGIIEYVNPQQCATSGYLPEELVGRNARIFQSGETSAPVYQAMWATIEAGNAWYGELLNRRKDGEIYWEFLHISPVLGNDGEILHFFTIKEENLTRRQRGGGEEVTASIDPLTGVLNRIAFHARLEQAIKRQAQVAGAGGLLVAHIDIDRFDSFNQVLGHATADRLLVEVARRIRHCIRREDELARIGGDEFAVLLAQDEDREANVHTVRRILAAIGQPLTLDQHELIVTASMGIACCPLDGRDTQTLLNNAHVAMTVAKRKGGETVCFYEPTRSVAADRIDLAGKLRHAIDRGEMVLHYQPQVSLVSGEIVGLEALVRWNRPGIGLVPPGIFIPVAEGTGLITLIGKWVLGEAVAQIVAWHGAGVPPMKVAVNLSANHFHDEHLPDFVAALLQEQGVAPHLLELELTESAMMRDVVQVRGIVDRLKGIGVHISLDDFGTGHSSLAYLSRFPIDLLKIDRIFVSDVTSNPVNASIVAATIAMAHKLGKNVIAEGVETEAQMSFLRRHDCDQMQGFLFSRPCPPDEIAAMLRQRRRYHFNAERSEPPRQTLLLVDDEPNVLSGLTRIFRREGYRLLTASNGIEALELLAVNRVQVIISDQRMPEMTGIELLSRVKDLYPETIRIILSGYAELATVTDAVNRGAVWKYFTKPWPEDSLREVVRQAFRQAGRPTDE